MLKTHRYEAATQKTDLEETQTQNMASLDASTPGGKGEGCLQSWGASLHNLQHIQNLSQIPSSHGQYQFWRDKIKEQSVPSGFPQPEDV